MSHSEMTHGAGNETGMDHEGLPHMVDGEKEAEEATIPSPVGRAPAHR